MGNGEVRSPPTSGKQSDTLTTPPQRTPHGALIDSADRCLSENEAAARSPQTYVIRCVWDSLFKGDPGVETQYGKKSWNV